MSKRPTSYYTYFTLLEMLVVLFLVGIVSAGSIFGIQHAIKQERFQQNSKLFIECLQLFQDIMMYSDLDSTIHLIEKDNGTALIAHISGFPQQDYLLKKEEKQRFSRIQKAAETPLFLKNLYLSFTDAKDSNKFTKNILLSYEAAGERMPEGTLSLYKTSQRDEKDSLHVEFLGYPRQKYKLLQKKTFENYSKQQEKENNAKFYPREYQTR